MATWRTNSSMEGVGYSNCQRFNMICRTWENLALYPWCKGPTASFCPEGLSYWQVYAFFTSPLSPFTPAFIECKNVYSPGQVLTNWRWRVFGIVHCWPWKPVPQGDKYGVQPLRLTTQRSLQKPKATGALLRWSQLTSETGLCDSVAVLMCLVGGWIESLVWRSLRLLCLYASRHDFSFMYFHYKGLMYYSGQGMTYLLNSASIPKERKSLMFPS